MKCLVRTPEEVFLVVEVFFGAGISVETASVEEEHSRGQPVKRLIHMYRKHKTLKRRIVGYTSY